MTGLTAARPPQDKNQNDPQATEKFQELQEAYEATVLFRPSDVHIVALSMSGVECLAEITVEASHLLEVVGPKCVRIGTCGRYCQIQSDDQLMIKTVTSS